VFDTTTQRALEEAVRGDPVQAIGGLGPELLTGPEIFELEMQYIFEGDWIYLAHESQIPEGNAYFRTWLGSQPTVIARTRNGKLNAFVAAFDRRSRELIKVARFESYRGFLFGSLNSEVAPLVQHLGAAAKLIDLFVDQSPEGLEVLRGALTVLCDNNWKMPAGKGSPADVGQDARYLYFQNGHLTLRAHRQLSLCLYPNVLLLEQGGQIRHYRPITVDQTEVTIYCMAPRGESAVERVRRLRQFEEICNDDDWANRQELGLFAIQHRYWQEAMRRALSAERRL
jgi:benzoate/toluate 1,2-dioxygenase subunit alpha